MALVLLFLFVAGSTSSPTDISPEAAENFLGSGQRTPEELKRLKENLQRLNKRTRKDLNAHSRSKKRNLVLFSHDEEPQHAVPSPKLPSDETTINEKLPVRDYLYQGDMALTAPQVEERLRSRLSRAAIHDSSFPNTKWDPNKVPYYFDPSLPTKARTRVRDAMDYIERYTCVRFVEDQRAEPRVKIFRGSGCWTYVGRQHTWKTQELSIGSNCDNHLGVMTHELMHVLGFYHEQARNDRDDYITINPYNIDPNNTNQFTKEKDSDTQNFPYEYGSVMHYASSLYAKDDKLPVFTAKDPNYATTMGQRMKPSFQDLQQINELYGCWKICDNFGTECGNGGIPNANNCSSCFCPYGFGGKYCLDVEKPTAKNPDCGGVLQAEPGVWKTLSGSVASGMESNSDWLVTPESCWWHIKSPAEKRIAARVTKMTVVDCDSSCAFSHIEIKTGSFKQTGYRLCCSEQKNIIFNSTARVMAVGVNVRLYTTSFELEYTAISSFGMIIFLLLITTICVVGEIHPGLKTGQLLRSRISRSAIHDSDFPKTIWDDGRIPYYFDASLPTITRSRARVAMDYLEKYTCVRFVEDRNAEPRVKILKGTGCWSNVGKVHYSQTQELSLGGNCDNHLGVMTHELMHTLGFYHEQSRMDRDSFVTVNNSNIEDKDAFKEEEGSDTQGFKFEYGSVMHYASSGSAINKTIAVMVAKDPLYATTMGQRMKPSFQDLQQINELYGCWKICDNFGTECGNGGVPNPNNCSSCFCPYGFGGKYCLDVEKSTAKNPGCERKIDAETGVWKTLSGSVTSGMTSNTDWLVTPESCWWHIRAPAGKRISAKVTKLSVVDCDSSCAFSHLEIKTGNFTETGYRLCCPEQKNIVFNSTARIMAIGVSVRLYTTSFELEYTAI